MDYWGNEPLQCLCLQELKKTMTLRTAGNTVIQLPTYYCLQFAGALLESARCCSNEFVRTLRSRKLLAHRRATSYPHRCCIPSARSWTKLIQQKDRSKSTTIRQLWRYASLGPSERMIAAWADILVQYISKRIVHTSSGINAKSMSATKKQATARTRNTRGNRLIHIRTHQGIWLSGDWLRQSHHQDYLLA